MFEILNGYPKNIYFSNSTTKTFYYSVIKGSPSRI